MVAPAAVAPQALTSDLDLLRLHDAWPDRYPYLLESVAQGAPQARYDMLFATSGEMLVLYPDGRLWGPFAAAGSFLAGLDAWWRAERAEDTREWPFTGGWFVFLGFELAGEIEPRLRLPRAEGDFPTAFAARCPAALIRDRQNHTLQVVSEPGYGALAERLRADARRVAPLRARPASAWIEVREDPPQAYRDAVKQILEYIRAGDVFQVNIARAWRAQSAGQEGDATGLYQALRRANPAPFAGIARHGDGAVISSSPERLVQVQGERVQTRPIAGTGPRAQDARDRALSDALLKHPKERAEHIMLIDLERNDLGRVCVPGSVRVSELMVLESYAHVHHMVSNVQGRLRPGTTPGQVIRAVFPGGTITGCPKVRCMEIIAQLENTGRGPYTGAMGYLNRNGDLDLNILIRTLVQQGKEVSLRAGAGIVADSDAERELHETRAKAKGLLLAMGVAQT